uniref:Uncharacterized protein n=1 Tax=Amphimedon queenslandica TaxID=400682 RepID=A0A1X7SSC8_AMPQE
QSTSSSTTTATVAATEDPKAVELWLIIQILCAILLILSLLCCCCMCSGEARNYSNKKSRSREITNNILGLCCAINFNQFKSFVTSRED